MKCRNCGSEIMPGEDFCLNCGTVLSNEDRAALSKNKSNPLNDRKATTAPDKAEQVSAPDNTAPQFFVPVADAEEKAEVELFDSQPRATEPEVEEAEADLGSQSADFQMGGVEESMDTVSAQEQAFDSTEAEVALAETDASLNESVATDARGFTDVYSQSREVPVEDVPEDNLVEEPVVDVPAEEPVEDIASIEPLDDTVAEQPLEEASEAEEAEAFREVPQAEQDEAVADEAEALPVEVADKKVEEPKQETSSAVQEAQKVTTEQEDKASPENDSAKQEASKVEKVKLDDSYNKKKATAPKVVAAAVAVVLMGGVAAYTLDKTGVIDLLPEKTTVTSSSDTKESTDTTESKVSETESVTDTTETTTEESTSEESVATTESSAVSTTKKRPSGGETEAVATTRENVTKDNGGTKTTEATKPATKKPETTKPTTKRPETTKPTTKRSETTKPTTKRPETTRPTTNKLETTKPTTKRPETTKPTTKRPETTKPTTKRPETTKPTTKRPETTKPARKPYVPEGVVTPAVVVKDSNTYYVKPKVGLIIHAAPSKSSDKIFTMAYGGRVEILGYNSDRTWAYILYDHEPDYGWVKVKHLSKTYIDVKNDTPAEDVQKPDGYYKQSSLKYCRTNYGLNLRNEPSTDGKIAITIRYGMPVKVLGYSKTEEGWVYVYYPPFGLYGWVSSSYLTATQPK